MVTDYTGHRLYRVTSPTVLATLRDGSSHAVMRGEVLPRNIDRLQLQHLLDLELVEEWDGNGGPTL